MSNKDQEKDIKIPANIEESLQDTLEISLMRFMAKCQYKIIESIFDESVKLLPSKFVEKFILTILQYENYLLIKNASISFKHKIFKFCVAHEQSEVFNPVLQRLLSSGCKGLFYQACFANNDGGGVAVIKSMLDYFERHKNSKEAMEVATRILEDNGFDNFQHAIAGSTEQGRIVFDWYALVRPEKNEIIEGLQLLFVKLDNEITKTHKKGEGDWVFYDEFCYGYAKKIMQLVNITGIIGVKYLNSKIADSIELMARCLDIMPKLKEDEWQAWASYFAAFKKSEKERGVADLIGCMRLMNALIKLEYFADKPINKRKDYGEIIKGFINDKRPESIKDLHFLLGTIIVKELFIKDSLKPEEVVKILKRVPVYSIVKLVFAARKLRKEACYDAYMEMVRCDLMGEGVDQFLHDLNKKNATGRKIADYNFSTRELLKKKGISPKIALNYDKQLDVVIALESDAVIDTVNQYHALWTYIEKLQGIVEKISFQKHSDLRLKALGKHLNSLEKLVSKQRSSGRNQITIADIFSKKLEKNLLLKIIGNLKALADKHENVIDALSENLRAGFKEFAGHVLAQFNMINMDRPETRGEQSKNRAQKRSVQFFTIKQWPKYEASTFFLGDEVGCCLATDSSNFRAMVQRRMDDALLFHVAIDKRTGKPAALIWLYLAVKSNGDVALVANFFEVKATHAKNANVRKALLNSLLLFTHQYCQDNPNIKGFYLAELEYGHNVGDLQEHELVNNMKFISKVGHPICLDQSGEEVRDVKKVQLSSLCDLSDADLAAWLAKSRPSVSPKNTKKTINYVRQLLGYLYCEPKILQTLSSLLLDDKAIDKALSGKLLYLPSLVGDKKFHLSSLEVAKKQLRELGVVQEKQQIIKQAVLDYLRFNRSVDGKIDRQSLINYVAKKRVQLAPFYSRPMERDVRFVNDVAKQWRAVQGVTLPFGEVDADPARQEVGKKSSYCVKL